MASAMPLSRRGERILDRVKPKTAFRSARDMRRQAGPAASSQPDRAVLGVLALLASTALFPVSDVAAKLLTTDLPAIEVAWLRYVVFVAMTLPVLLRGRGVLITARPALQVGRALASVLATTIAILSFSVLPVAESTAIGFLSPVIVTALAALFLGERVGRQRWCAAVLGLAGVLIIVQPGSAAFHAVSLIPLAGSLVGALSAITTRMVKDERPDATLFYSAIVGFVLLSAAVALHWQTPTWQQVAVGAVVGFFATLASLMQVFAYRNASASLLAPFSYTQLVWAAGLGFAAFGTVPSAAMLCGAAVIVAGGILSVARR